MKHNPQDWFEMKDIRKRSLNKSVWIPILSNDSIMNDGESGQLGFMDDFYGVGSVMIPVTQKKEAEKLDWNDIGLQTPNSGHMCESEYIPANIYKNNTVNIIGEFLIVEGQGDSSTCSEWYVSPDFLSTLKLIRSGDVWLASEHGYEEVVRLTRNKDGCIASLEIKTEYLKDYLCARKMSLYVTSYRQRTQIVDEQPSIDWPSEHKEITGLDYWEGCISAIHEGGHQFGSEFSVFHVGRTDVDFEEDVPEYGFPTDDQTESQSFRGKYDGKKLYRIDGELWRREWIDPADFSTKVLGDDVVPTVFFITDNQGTSETRKTLSKGSRWLWFQPTIINSLLGYRGSTLEWYTRDTGRVGCRNTVHFGINQLGLINVYAKDIAHLPDWEQKVWAGHNVTPNGKVSEELLMSQMQAQPANTQAPENYLMPGLSLLDENIQKKFGIKIFRETHDWSKIIEGIHRFKAENQVGLLTLAKEIYKAIGERIDSTAIKKTIESPKGEVWGPLKSLEKLLAKKTKDEEAYKLLNPLWALYTLRNANSHLGSNDKVTEALNVLKINIDLPYPIQGLQLLTSVVSCVYEMIGNLENKSSEDVIQL